MGLGCVIVGRKGLVALPPPHAFNMGWLGNGENKSCSGERTERGLAATGVAAALCGEGGKLTSHGMAETSPTDSNAAKLDAYSRGLNL